jgi:hypothetical protein
MKQQSKELIKDSTKFDSIEKFEPNENQKKWLDTAIKTMSKEVTAIAEECRIDRTTWYVWIQDPEFVAWYTAEWDRRLKAHSPKLDVIGMKMAERDPKVLELMMKRVGTLHEDKGAKVQINNFIPILGGEKVE